MKRFYCLILFALIASAATFADAAEKTVTYTFSKKSWNATNDSGDAANWDATQDGANFTSGQGVKISTNESGVTATCPNSYNKISKVVVSYCTNKSAGEGSVTISAGETSSSQDVTKDGGTTTRDLTYSFDTAKSGNVSLTVTCITNAIYISSVAITYEDGLTRSEKPVFSVTEGFYDEAQTISLSTTTAGAKIYYKINDASDYSTYSDPISLSEEGIYTITAYTGATDTTEKSFEVENTYTISFPLAEPYKLCTNAALLEDKAKVIFVGDLLGLGMAGYNSDGYMNKADVKITENELTNKSPEIKVFTVGVTESGITFSTDGNYLQGSTSASKLKYKTEPDESCYWTISSIDTSTGEADVTMKSNDTKYLRYYPQGNRFGTYASSSGVLYIFLLESTSSASKVSANDGVKVFGTEGGVVVCADKATDVAVYTVAGQLVSKTAVAAGTSTVDVAPGFYVVRAADTVAKVVVK